MKMTLSMTVREFCRSVKLNRLFVDLEQAYLQTAGRNAGRAERDSWAGSLPRLSGVLELCELSDSVRIGHEVRVPY